MEFRCWSWTPDALCPGRLYSYAAVTTGKRKKRSARPRLPAKAEGRFRCRRRERDLGAIDQECEQSPNQLLQSKLEHMDRPMVKHDPDAMPGESDRGAC